MKREKEQMKTLIVVGAIFCAIIMFGGNSNSKEMMITQSGADLFKKHCAPCHGNDAAGQDPSQPSGGYDAEMNRIAPALNGTGHSWHHPPELIYEYIEKGSIDETSPMPSFGSILKGDDIKAIIAHINSLWPDEIIERYRKRFPKEEL